MNILHIIDSGGLYGAEKILLTLMQEQKQQGDFPLLVSMGNKNDNNKELEQEAKRLNLNCEIIRLRKGPDFSLISKLSGLCKTYNINIIHSHGYKSNIILSLAPKKRLNLPMLTTIHGWTSTNKLSKKYSYELLESFLLRRMDAVVLVNEAMKTDSRLSGLGKSKIHVIYNSLGFSEHELNENEQQYIKEYINSDKDFVIGSVGRLSKEKAFINIVNIAEEIRQKIPNVKFLIFGDGPERESLMETINMKNLDSCFFLPGYVADAGKYIQCFNIFLISSSTEGLPVVLIEAMHSKTAIVSSNVGGIPSVIEDNVNGMLFDSNDLEKMKQHILFLSRDKAKARELTENACNYAQNNFSSVKMTNKYKQLYSTLIN